MAEITVKQSIILLRSEGVLSGTLSMIVDGEKHTAKNCKESWNRLKELSDRGIRVIDRLIRWDNTITDTAWESSPSYIYRFGANGDAQ